jgi:hypothetical protein
MNMASNEQQSNQSTTKLDGVDRVNPRSLKEQMLCGFRGTTITMSLVLAFALLLAGLIGVPFSGHSELKYFFNGIGLFGVIRLMDLNTKNVVTSRMAMAIIFAYCLVFSHLIILSISILLGE